MPIKVFVNGAQGKMGQAVIAAIKHNLDYALVGCGDSQTDLAMALRNTQPQVAVDFTVPAAAWQNAKIIIEAGVHPVIGTTGFTLEQITALQMLSQQQQLGGLIAPNFSLGMILLMHCAQLVGRYLPDVTIIEMHQPKKLDAPAGTAKKTAEMIAKTRASTVPIDVTPNASLGLNYQDIPIHAIRLPGFVASQEVIFGGQAEILSIRHDTYDRTTYMPGVLLACKKVLELSTLVYGLEHLLDL